MALIKQKLKLIPQLLEPVNTALLTFCTEQCDAQEAVTGNISLFSRNHISHLVSKL